MRHLEFEMRLRCSRPDAFRLLSNIATLDKVTPRWFRLIPVSGATRDPTVGSTIDYDLRWRGIPMRWRSVIRSWEWPSTITYEQAAGPFRKFRHEHLFLEHDFGVRIVDRIDFDAPGGRRVRQWIIEPDLARIFAFRQTAVQALLDGTI